MALKEHFGMSLPYGCAIPLRLWLACSKQFWYAVLASLSPERGPVMAAFRQHVTFSSLLGVGYAAVLKGYGWDTGKSLLAGALCGLAGMLPDLDSDSGKPIRELFGLLATVGSLFVLHRLSQTDWQPADRILAAGCAYLFLRFGVSWVFARLTVHRGMWHSIPAACFMTELTFLASAGFMGDVGGLVMAGGVFVGFLSHLVLDEIYSVNLNGVVPRLKQSSGSALKLFSHSALASIVTWLALGLTSYQSAVKLGYAPDWLPKSEQIQTATHSVLARLGVSERWLPAMSGH
jgi:hypothetical protein